MPDVRITLFGALEIVHGTAAPQRPPTQRVLSLLGYLITHCDVPQSRDKLVDLLWPDLEPRQGRRVLSDTLWRARRLLTPPAADDTPLLVVTGDAVTFRPNAATWIDVLAFEHLVRMASADQAGHPAPIEQLAAAVELYRGDFLEECYDDWALYERERLRELFLSALQRLLAHYQRVRAYESALQIALQLVRADPLREDTHRELMRLYYLLGRESDALRAFERCRALLEQELGVDPDPETLSLYEEISAMQQRRAQEHVQVVGGQGSGAVAHHPVPRELPFVNRRAQRSAAMEAVEQAINGSGGLVLIAGEAGMGKSRLLREVASGAGWRGAQVCWGYGREDAQALPFGPLREALSAALTPLRARQVTELVSVSVIAPLVSLLPHLAEVLPEVPLLAAPTSERQIATLHAAIATTVQALGQITPQVIILEDLHWFDPATLDALTALLPSLRSARVLLILSGRSDELPHRPAVWEALLRFDRIGPFQRIDLAGLSEADCADLVQRALRLRQPAPRFSARLFQATGGNPFFILETLRALQEQGLLTRDAQGNWHTPWDSPGATYDNLPLPQSLWDAISERLRELAPHEREALAAAAVLGQRFAPTTLAGMTGGQAAANQQGAAPATGATASDTQSLAAIMRQLLRRQFLVEDDTGYRFGHETLREVIYDTLDDTARQSLHLRAAEALEQEHFARVEALAQHLYLAGAWSKAVPYLIQAGDQAHAVHALQDALRCYSQALEAAIRGGFETTDLPTLWDIQLKRGAVATPLGDYPTAIAAFEEVLRLTGRDATLPGAPARLGSQRSAQIQALNGLGYVYGQRNDYDRARQAIQQAMALAAESPRLIDRAEAFYQAGQLSSRVDDYAETRRYLTEAMNLYDALGLETARAKCLSMIGLSYQRQNGPTDQAIDYFVQALDAYRRQRDRFGENWCLAGIANAHLMRGRLVEVVQAVEQCLPFFESINALDEVAGCLFTRGEAYRRMGRLDEALEALQQSLAICRRLDRHAAAEFTQIGIAAALRDRQHYVEALKELRRPLRANDRMIKVRALLVAVDICRRTCQFDYAWHYLTEGFVLTRQLGSKTYDGLLYRGLAQLCSVNPRKHFPTLNEQIPHIETSFAESIRLLREAYSEDELALTYLAYGEFLIHAGRKAEAKAMLTQAQTLIWGCGMASALSTVQRLLQSLEEVPVALLPGQRRVRLARQGVPRGRPLRPEELVEVIWTIEPNDHAHGETERMPGRMTSRQEHLRRLCAEAAAQGAEPTLSDLAEALGVTIRTVHRDISAMRAAGEVLMTRRR